MVPLLQKQPVQNHHWLTNKESIGAIAIGQVTPRKWQISRCRAGYPWLPRSKGIRAEKAVSPSSDAGNKRRRHFKITPQKVTTGNADNLFNNKG